MEPNPVTEQPQPTVPPTVPTPTTPPVPPIPPVATLIPPVSSLTPASGSNSKKRLVLWIIGVIVALVAVITLVVGFILWKYPPVIISSYEECFKAKGSYIQESNPPTCVTSKGLSFRKSTSSATQSSQSETTPFSDLANNWRIYTNSTFGFSLQYPPAWKITTDPKPEGAQFINEQPIVLIHDGQLRPDPDVGPNSTYPTHYVGISTLASSKTLQEFLDSMVLGFSPEEKKDTREFMDQKALMINGILAVSFIEPGMGGRGRLIAVSNGTHIVLFSFPYQFNGEKNDNFTQDKDYVQILSTFKFVN